MNMRLNPQQINIIRHYFAKQPVLRAYHLSQAFQTTHAEIPWAQIVAFRNVLTHQYFGLDERSIWDIVRNNLPVLKMQIARILESN